MKKQMRALTLLLAALMLAAALLGCGTRDQKPDADPADPGETPVTDDTRIEPIPSDFDPANLEDCIFTVSFTNDDITLNDAGTLVLHMTVWEQELFDAAEITALKEGDTIVVCGEEITVASVERTDNVVYINGGPENGGIILAPSESGGTFYESGAGLSENDIMYTSVAQVTLPVNGDEFVYTDASDIENGEKTYLAGDLLTMKDSVDFGCTTMNAIAHIINNQVTEIVRIYRP